MYNDLHNSVLLPPSFSERRMDGLVSFFLRRFWNAVCASLGVHDRTERGGEHITVYATFLGSFMSVE